MPILQNPINENTLSRLAGETSFDRGMQYYKQGRIKKHIFDGIYIRTQIQGSKVYDTTICLKEGNIISYTCTCPAGGFCKHLVASALEFLNSSAQHNKAKNTFIADFNSEMSLILLGILGLYGSELSKDDLLKYYREVSGTTKAREEISLEIDAYKLLYRSFKIFDNDSFMIARDEAYPFIKDALNSKYRKPIIDAVQSHLNKTFTKDPKISNSQNYYYSRLNFYFYTNNDIAFMEYAKIFEEKKGQFYGYVALDELMFFVSISFNRSFSYSDFLFYKPYFHQFLIKNFFARFVYQGLRSKIFDELIKNNHYVLNSRNNIELSLDALLMDLELEKLNQLCSQLLSEDPSKSYINFYIASYEFLQGNLIKAQEQFELGLKAERKITQYSHTTITEGPAIFYTLTLMSLDARKNKAKIERCIKKNSDNYCKTRFYLLQILFDFLTSTNDEGFQDLSDKFQKINFYEDSFDWLLVPFYYYLAYFIDDSKLENNELVSRSLPKDTPGFGLKILRDVLTETHPDLVSKLPSSDLVMNQNLLDLKKIFPKKSAWENKFELLKQHFGVSKDFLRSNQAQRFCWIIDSSKKKLILKKQQKLKTGGWSVGQNYFLDSYCNVNDNEGLLNVNEKNIIKIFQDDYEDYYDRNNDEEDFSSIDKALIMLCGLKNIYDDIDAFNRVELVHSKPHLELTQSRKGFYRIKLSHDFNSPQVFLEKQNLNTYSVIECGPNLVQISKLLGKSGIEIPIESESEIKKLLKSAETDLEIVSELDYEDLPTVKAVNKIYALVFFDAFYFKLKIELMMNPSGDGKNLVLPATGREMLKVVDAQGRKIIYQRNFSQEQGLLDSCLNALNSSNPVLERNGVGDCLDLISALEKFKKENPETIDIEWKQGERIRTLPRVNFKSLNMKLKSKNNWFEYTGEINIDEDRVINLKDLISNITRADGNYVKLNTGEFLGLTEELKIALQKLRYISDDSGEKLHKLTLPSILDLENSGASIAKDKEWEDYLSKLKAFDDLKIETHPGFKAVLRDYQYEGFIWLSRLAHLGVGACLADDMGLGKTVQTIALLMNQAQHKPCIVVAPTSVVNNWQSEIEKFTEGLNAFVLSDYGSQNETRKELIEALKPGDILLCSYGLLQTQIETLQEIDFGMVVLDESQAIKNPFTKRAQAAKMLKSNFRLVLTGTPIENNLAELWSQFDFINPGLLSSLKNFQGKFANAIEINKDKVAQSALKQLIQPYILRRTKDEVLDDLPPKIEQTIKIEFDADEAAFYEVLRTNALEKLQEAESENNFGKRKLLILAEMSKLRRACCHPSLIDDKREYSGSKNQEFYNLVTELKASKHKALVFSQYTSYLKLLRQGLDMMEINYLYLDGSTPAKKRKELVQEFQNGSADLFLLSLKAGGSGLNLTSADYVIHLDPWWNPAVEDQATDRAHRIGQKKTVNVYRLIMKSSIEERILQLHDTKRELADELLDEAKITARLTDKELLDMMRA